MNKTKMIFNVVAWAYFTVKVDNTTGRVYLKQKTTIDTNNLTENNIKFKMNCHIDDFKKYVDAGLFIQCDDKITLCESYKINANEEIRESYKQMFLRGRQNQFKRILKNNGHVDKIKVDIVNREIQEDTNND